VTLFSPFQLFLLAECTFLRPLKRWFMEACSFPLLPTMPLGLLWSFPFALLFFFFFSQAPPVGSQPPCLFFTGPSQAQLFLVFIFPPPYWPSDSVLILFPRDLAVHFIPVSPTHEPNPSVPGHFPTLTISTLLSGGSTFVLGPVPPYSFPELFSPL